MKSYYPWKSTTPYAPQGKTSMKRMHYNVHDWWPDFTFKNFLIYNALAFVGGFVGSFLMDIHMFGWHETLRRFSGLWT
jgi:hypothetical protein